MDFFEKISSLFRKKKTADGLLQEKMSGILNEMNKLSASGIIQSPENRIKFSNVKLMVRGVADQFTSFSNTEVEEISENLHLLISDIKNSAFGIGGGFDTQRVSLSKATGNYLALLAFYIDSNVNHNGAQISHEEMKNYRLAAKSVCDNEALDVSIQNLMKDIDSINEEILKLHQEEEAIFAKLSAKKSTSDPEIEGLVERQAEIEEIIETKKSDLLELKNEIAGLRDRKNANAKYIKYLERIKRLDDAISRQTFKDNDELYKTVQLYQGKKDISDAEMKVTKSIFEAAKPKAQEKKPLNPRMAEALKKIAENEEKAKTKAQDAANFDVDSEENENGD